MPIQNVRRDENEYHPLPKFYMSNFHFKSSLAVACIMFNIHIYIDWVYTMEEFHIGYNNNIIIYIINA